MSHGKDVPEKRFVKIKRVGLGKNKYQKAVTLKKLEVVAMEAIEPAANINCEIRRTSPVRVPGVPAKSFISLSKPKKFQILQGSDKFPTNQNFPNTQQPIK